jgi:predicted nucleic acid-binding protein
MKTVIKVLFDTHVILDVLLNREPFVAAASQLMTAVERNEIKGYLGATTVTTLFYLMAKTLGKAAAEENLHLLLRLFDVATVNQAVIETALDSAYADFEDAVLYSAAALVECDAIVTRNIKYFKSSTVPVYAPDELLAVLGV